MTFITQFFQQPPLMVGLIALIGLIALKKNIGEIVSGTLKSIIGFIILQVGAGAIVGALGNLGPVFQQTFNLQGVIPTNEAIIGFVQQSFGQEMALLMAFGFVVNIILARITPLKYIFLTGHHIFYMAGLIAVVLNVAGFSGVELIIVGSLLLGSTMVITPALVQPYYRNVTGNNSVAMGHYNALTYALGAWLSSKVGNKENSTEDVEVPENLSFFRDNIVTTGIVMSVIFIVVMLVADKGVVAKQIGEGKSVIISSLMLGLKFTAGFAAILYGVRMMLGEIVPAFKGIAQKIVPNAVPALDCPVIFPYAPNAVIIGFLSSVVGGVIAAFIIPVTGLAVIIPGLIPLFFVGAAVGVLANGTGGLRGTIIAGIFNGALITTLPALLLPVMGKLGFKSTTYGDADFAVVGILTGYLAKLFSKPGVYFLLGALAVIFVIITLIKEPPQTSEETEVGIEV